ncbi:MAG: heparinase II/III family protein [Cyclobacteriaceae bacterium]
MRKRIGFLAGLLCLMILAPSHAQTRVNDLIENKDGNTKLDNPISAQYLKKHLNKKSPKLLLTPAIEKKLIQKLKSDPLAQNYYRYLQKEADLILEKPLLKRELEGFRLLAVSREMLGRMGILCMVYRIDKSPEILNRIDAELQAVCKFQDWNPQHYLDVAEMSLAVALATDWAGTNLPKETLKLAKSALIEKGILPSYNDSGERMGWVNGSNNWNAVCHGGMIAASLAIADMNPELAARTISRALEKLPNSLKEYAPDGVYPEGPTYWAYGTSYTIIAASILTTALGTDFGITKSPGLMESANFILQVTSPSGDFFNFADSGDKKGGNESILLSWFAAKTGDGLYFDRSFLENPENAGRWAGPGLIWLSQFSQEKVSDLPLNWHGRGTNPVVVFRGQKNDPGNFYLAAKGGKAQLSHGNMDAGTFVFELNGVRWVIDPGNQNYYLLNRIGFNLAGGCQDCPRWTLLTKKNQGHSTISINDNRFQVTGYAPVTDFKDTEKPEASIDLTELYGGNIASLKRKIVKESNVSILIEDQIEVNDSTRNVTWGLMTVADVVLVKNGAILKQDGKELRLSILTPENLNISIISLDPPPMEIDKSINNLKRLEIRIPAWTIENGNGTLRVRLSGK